MKDVKEIFQNIKRQLGPYGKSTTSGIESNSRQNQTEEGYFYSQRGKLLHCPGNENASLNFNADVKETMKNTNTSSFKTDRIYEGSKEEESVDNDINNSFRKPNTNKFGNGIRTNSPLMNQMTQNASAFEGSSWKRDETGFLIPHPISRKPQLNSLPKFNKNAILKNFWENDVMVLWNCISEFQKDFFLKEVTKYIKTKMFVEKRIYSDSKVQKSHCSQFLDNRNSCSCHLATKENIKNGKKRMLDDYHLKIESKRQRLSRSSASPSQEREDNLIQRHKRSNRRREINEEEYLRKKHNKVERFPRSSESSFEESDVQHEKRRGGNVIHGNKYHKKVIPKRAKLPRSPESPLYQYQGKKPIIFKEVETRYENIVHTPGNCNSTMTLRSHSKNVLMGKFEHEEKQRRKYPMTPAKEVSPCSTPKSIRKMRTRAHSWNRAQAFERSFLESDSS